MPSEVTCPNCATVSVAGTANCPRCGATLLEPTRISKPKVGGRVTTGNAPALKPRPAPGPTPVPLEEHQTNSGRSDPLIGQKLQEYVIRQRIGVGGMGIVYRAEQTMIGKQVAIKVLRPDVVTDPRDMERLLDEARVVNSINHRGIINIFGAGTTDSGRHYLIMELLDGESLEDRMSREGIIASGDAVQILEEVLSALAAAHQAGVVHRDLKPANVFLAKEGTRFYVKLLDFGLARRSQVNVTRIAGTPDYISPEHARGKVAGPASDLYAFGILCFHMLTGRLPFEGNTPMEVMEKHVHSPPPVPHEVNKAIPRALSELILKLLAKDPTQRPDATQVKADLRSATRQMRNASTQSSMDSVAPVAASESAPTPVDLPQPTAKAAARTAPAAAGGSSKLPVLIGGALALLAILLVALFFVMRGQDTAKPNTVELTPEVKPVEPKPTALAKDPTPTPTPVEPPTPDEVVLDDDAGPIDDNAPLDDTQRGQYLNQLRIGETVLAMEVYLSRPEFPQELKGTYKSELAALQERLDKARTPNQLTDMVVDLQGLRGRMEKAAATNFGTLPEDPVDAGAAVPPTDGADAGQGS